MPLQAGVERAALVLPHNRIRRGKAMAAAAAFDQDTITLAADAALAVLDGTEVAPAALLLATVSPPLAEGGAVQVLAELTGLSGIGVHVQEHGGTIAAAGSALVSAAALIAAGIGPVLLVAADTRRDAGGTPFGDAAVALLLDASGAIGELSFTGSAAEAFPDRWRSPDEEAVVSGDDSLLPFGPAVAHTRALFDGGAARTVGSAGPPIPRAGLLGCAALPAALLLDADEPTGLAVSAGGVTHAFHFEPGPGHPTSAAAARAVVAAGVESAPTTLGAETGFAPYTSGPRAWRDRHQDLGLLGVRCADCVASGSSGVLFPAPPSCPVHGPDARLEPHRLARTGTVLTCTRDHLFPHGGPLTMCVVEIDGGGRFYGQSAGSVDVHIGDRVRLVPRLLHSGGDRPQYFWKVQPRED